MGFERCGHEPNLYRRDDGKGNWIIVGVLTDNYCLILPSSPSVVKSFMNEYKGYYRITGGDEVTKFDGQELRRSEAADGSYRYTITQTQYIERVYKKYVTTSSDRARVSPIDVGADGVTPVDEKPQPTACAPVTTRDRHATVYSRTAARFALMRTCLRPA